MWQARGELASFPLGFLSVRTGAPATYAPAPPVSWPPEGAAQWNLLAVAGPAGRSDGSDLAALPGLDDELRFVTAGWARVRVLRGEEAIPAQFWHASESAEVFHFAGHAIPWRGSMALVATPDPGAMDEEGRAGLLALKPPLRLRARLAVLSACSTAALGEEDSLDPSRLAESALAAGARKVIATLWDVDSVASSQFAQHFYAALRQSQTPEAALRKAMERLRANPRFTHPYYWAPYALYQRSY
ncbi:MAG: CHAT domain-containing protein [Bryobacterales bacterium]|nr:CHAT domain-containing protein [Bryobacterales bacterium]